MSSRRWFACTPPSPARADRSRPRATGAPLAVLLLGLVLAVAGCSSFRSALPLGPRPSVGATDRDAAVGDLAAAGVLVATGPGPAAPTAEADALAQALDLPGVEPALSVDELVLLLQPPATLAARSAELAVLRSRLGHRYAAVASRGLAHLRHSSTWDVILVIPTPWIFLWFDWPIPIRSPATHPHDADVARIVDLDRAEIVAESFVVWRGGASNEPYDRARLAKAFEELGWEGGQ